MQRLLLRVVAVMVAALGTAQAQRPDVLVADFESAAHDPWRVEGEAFGPGPAEGTLPSQMEVTGFVGHRLVNSYHGGDGSTGRLISAPFPITRDHVAFLIGGGGHEGRTCVNLIVDGRIERTATGPNLMPGGSERLDPASWDVRDFKGKEATIEIVDTMRGGWGHINVDQIVLTDTPPPLIDRFASRELVAAERFLNLPVQTGAPMRRLRVLVGEDVYREMDIELADGEPEWWATLDLSEIQGKPFRVEVDRLPRGSQALANLHVEAATRDGAELYRESLRPRFHFSPRRGWNNDPNGLVFAFGTYHLYFQHNPYGWAWGNMHWGHALSDDLAHWQEEPIALYPRQHGDWAFSGSAAVDWKNTSGFGQGADPPLVLAYTSTGRGECIAYSLDRGHTWTEYVGNPVVEHAGRDPRIFWHEPSQRWVMAVYDEQPNPDGGKRLEFIAFYTAPDLKTWTFQSRIEGFFECPDLFPLVLDGQEHWVISAANAEYRLGAFDGARFTPTTPKLPGNHGNCFYAAQTFNDVPDGRRIQVGWLRAPSPGMPFNQCMSVPLELTLAATDDGPRLRTWPVAELDTLHGASRSWERDSLEPGKPLRVPLAAEHDLSLTIDPGQAQEIRLDVRGVAVVVDVAGSQLRCLDHTAPLPCKAGEPIRLRMLVDRTSIELFAEGGLVYMPLARLVDPGQTELTIEPASGPTGPMSLRIHAMNPMWRAAQP